MRAASWRATILDHLAREGELAIDSLHEATRSESDECEMMSAVESLISEQRVTDTDGVLTVKSEGLKL